MADPLDEFSSEGQPPNTAALCSLEEILRREVAINWDEAVALVEEVCSVASPAETGVPEPADLYLADGTVVRGDAGRAQSDVSSAGRLLHSLLSGAGTTPVPLRLFVTQASAQGAHASLAEFAKALAYFGKANRTELIRALYRRCANGPAPSRVAARASEPKREPRHELETKPARRRRTIPRWAVAMIAAVILSAAAVAVWSMRSRFGADVQFSSLVAQAREAVGRMGVLPPAEPASAASPVVAPEPKRATAARSVGALPTDAPRLVSRALGPRNTAQTRNRRRPSPVLPVLVVPPPSAELSARSADETAREALTHTVYSSTDADVEAPILLYPQIPANLMLAGESRLNIMELLVSETGLVETVRLVAGPSRLPDVMLLSGAKAWRFKPASRDGEAVRYRALVSWAGTP